MAKPVSAAIVLSVLTIAATGRAAEENLEFKFVVKPLDVKMLEAPNLPGQTITTMKAFASAFFTDGRIAAKDFIVTQDYNKGAGPFFGYSTYKFDDGSSIIARFEGSSKGPGSPLHGEYTILSGTGKYASAKGKGSFDALPAKFDGAFLYAGRFQITTNAAGAQ
jgi:hypothetical protein